MFNRDRDRDEARKQALEDAEITLKHMQDMGKQIDARESVVHAEMKPYSDRLRRNHFIQEYEELFRGNR